MNKDEKAAVVAELRKLFAGSESIILTDTSGVTVNAISTLRRRCRKEGITFRIAKNSLARLALQGTELEGIAEKFVGPTAFAIKAGDPVTPAKIVTEYAKENAKFKVKWAYLGGTTFDTAGVEALSKSKGRDELRAELLSLLVSGTTSFLGVLNTMGTQVLGLMAARADKLEKGE